MILVLTGSEPDRSDIMINSHVNVRCYLSYIIWSRASLSMHHIHLDHDCKQIPKLPPYIRITPQDHDGLSR